MAVVLTLPSFLEMDSDLKFRGLKEGEEKKKGKGGGGGGKKEKGKKGRRGEGATRRPYIYNMYKVRHLVMRKGELIKQSKLLKILKK